MSILCHIALRMILQQGTPEKALAEGRRLSSVFCKHSSMRDNDDFFRRCLMSTFLLRVLQKSEFFGRRLTESAEPTPNEMEVGALIFNYLQSLQFNAHEIYETVTKEHAFIKSSINYIGVGIYEVGAMFNHECYPSFTRYFNGSTLIYYTTRPHENGEVVAENYGPIFTKQTLAERQRNLQARYWFKCSCRACQQNWPVFEKLNNKCRMRCPTDMCEGLFAHPAPQDRSKNVKCGKCKQSVSLQTSLAVLYEAEEMFKSGAMAMEVTGYLKLHEILKNF
jgi:SET and MYND domain-containing protein 4